MNAFGISPNSFGLFMATAAYSPEGAAWVDALVAYLQVLGTMVDFSTFTPDASR
mgnify:CR=1 FL=1